MQLLIYINMFFDRQFNIVQIKTIFDFITIKTFE